MGKRIGLVKCNISGVSVVKSEAVPCIEILLSIESLL